MGTQFLLVLEKAGLLEFAHQLAQLEQGLQVTAIPAEIALRQGMLQKGRRGLGPAQVKHQVKALAVLARAAPEINGAGGAAGFDAITVPGAAAQVDLVIQADGLLGAGGDTGVAAGAQVQIDRVAARPAHLKSAQPARQALQLTGHDRVAPRLAAARLARAFGPEGDLQRIGQQVGRAFGSIQRAQDQQTSFAFVADRGHRLRVGQACSRQQGGHFGRGAGPFGSPARGLADVDETDWSHRPFGLLRQIRKQRLLLGAGHHHRLAALCGALESAGFAAAQGGVFFQFLTERATQGLGLQGQGLVAVADQGGHVVEVQPVPKNPATVPQLGRLDLLAHGHQGLVRDALTPARSARAPA